MRHATRLKAGTAMLLPFVIAACSERGDNLTGGTPPAPPPPAASVQNQIGASFASFFDASNTSDPRDPAPSDVPALNPAIDPITN